MARVRGVLVPAVSLAAAACVLVATPAGSDPGAAATSCLNKPVTIVASTSVTTGTEGDDVVAMTPLGWSRFDALGGNDTICLSLGIYREGRDPFPPTGWVEAGPGDDVVVYDSALIAGATGDMYVGLGTGDDSFTGNDVRERIYADSAVWAVERPARVVSGTQRDVISTGGGEDQVWTEAPEGGLNEDSITVGTGTDWVTYSGAMGLQGVLDVSASTFAYLELPQFDAVQPVSPGELVVDNVARRATMGGVEILRWNGEIRSFTFWHSPSTTSRFPVSFAGSDAAESVTVGGAPVGDVRLAAGDDSLSTYSGVNDQFVPRSADGGSGHDSVSLFTSCHVLAITLDRTSTCEGMTGVLISFDQVEAYSGILQGSRVTIIGTGAAERLRGTGDRVTVLGRGGADVIQGGGGTVRVLGGGGTDRISASGDDVVVRGQASGDRIRLKGSTGYTAKTRQQVALGGRGPDVLTGTTSRRSERLIGGRGRDEANGRAGNRDYCLAEITRHCELP